MRWNNSNKMLTLVASIQIAGMWATFLGVTACVRIKSQK